MSRVTAVLIRGATRGSAQLTRAAAGALEDAFVEGEPERRIAPPSPFVRILDRDADPPLSTFISVSQEDLGKLWPAKVIVPVLEPAGLWRPGPSRGRVFSALASPRMEALVGRLISALDGYRPYGWFAIWNTLATGSSGVPAPTGSLGDRRPPHFRGPVQPNELVYFLARHHPEGSALPFL